MPEGPEVRKHADALDLALKNRRITTFEARTREARGWLKENERRLVGHRVLRVTSHGKHLLGFIEGGFYFHSHLMMWGRWQTFRQEDISTPPSQDSDPIQATNLPLIPLDKDRRERARIVVNGGAAILFSAPIFNVGEGDPYQQIENLSTLGPDVLPTKGKFNSKEFTRRLLLPEHLDATIGAALLNQRILAGLGNYLRAEVLFNCRLNPWRKVGELKQTELRCLARTAPELSLRAYQSSATATEADRERMRSDASLVYQPGREYGTRHLVFRRTNLPCLRCGEPIRQLRQPTFNSEKTNGDEEGNEPERTRIVYFCAKCQNVAAAI
jgi:endonuclease-8